MKDPITFMEDIQSSFRKTKLISSLALIACIVISLGAIWMAYSFAKDSNKHIYVVDQGYVLAANRQDNAIQKDLEVLNHVRRFHELMYNLAPDERAITSNVSEAAALGVKPSDEIDRARREKSFYSQLIQLPAVEEFQYDSARVDVSSYPFKVRLYGTLWYIRPTNAARYSFQSYCELINTSRSPRNPHGLSIERFIVERQEQLEITTRR